jgi:hypothetical protein
MRRKTTLLVLLGVGAALAVFLKQRPDFYDGMAVPAGAERAARSAEFVGGYRQIVAQEEGRDTEWREVFTTEQINAFLQHDYLDEAGGYKKLPDGFRDLRVQVDDGLLRIGCRYGRFGGTVLSIEAKVWLVEGEPNVIGVELGNFRAGVLPVSRDVLLDAVAEAAAKSNVAVRWGYRDDVPVAYLRLQADRERPTILVRHLELLPGRMIVSGRTFAKPK